MTVQEFHRNGSTRPVNSWGWQRACLLCTSRARRPAERSGHTRACHRPRGHLSWRLSHTKPAAWGQSGLHKQNNRWDTFDELQLKTSLQTPRVWCHLFRYGAAGRPRIEGMGGGSQCTGRRPAAPEGGTEPSPLSPLLSSSGRACLTALATPASSLGLRVTPQGQSLTRKTTVFAFSFPGWVVSYSLRRGRISALNVAT